MTPRVWFLSFLFLTPFLIWNSSLRAEQAAGLSNIEIKNTDFTTSTEMRPAKIQPAAQASGFDFPMLKEAVMQASTRITVNAEAPLQAEALVSDLGHFDSEMVLKPAMGQEYPLEVTMVYRKPEGQTHKVKLSALIQPDKTPYFSEKLIEGFSKRFADMVLRETQNLQGKYGPNFTETLGNFATAYARKTLEKSPDTVARLLSENKGKTEETPAPQKEAKEAASPEKESETVSKVPDKFRKDIPILDPLAVWQTTYSQDEELNFVEAPFSNSMMIVPEYSSLTSFLLTAQKNADEERYPLASVDYYVATHPTPLDRYETTFQIVVNYLLQDKVQVSEVFYHDQEIVEKDFFEVWKDRLMKPLSQKILAGAQGQTDELNRKLFLTYLEPYLYEEFYDFTSFLVKARVMIEAPETQKKLMQLIKENYEAKHAEAESK